MDSTDFPGLYQASDKASLSAQKYYKNIIAIDLVTMIIASALAIYNFKQIDPKLFVYIFSGVLLLISFALTIIIRTKKFEAVWYQGRALAESCKTLTWRFITCSESFEYNLAKQQVEDYFNNRVRELSQEFKELNKSLNAKDLVLPIITKKMWEIRNLNTLERKQYYIENRIMDQKEWYASKAESNNTKYNLWSWVIICSQLIAIISVGFLIRCPDSNWNMVGLFTTISASAISWLQLKQHQELKQAYTTAAQELNFIQASFGNINTDSELAEFVLDSENAISREHTLWLAQKRK
jgi:conflict system pore-forming effector with SLATT domain